MELKKEDFKKFRIVDTFFYALPVSFFEAPIGNPIPIDISAAGNAYIEQVKEVFETKEAKEIELQKEIDSERERLKKEAELAEIEKEEKRAELREKLKELE